MKKTVDTPIGEGMGNYFRYSLVLSVVIHLSLIVRLPVWSRDGEDRSSIYLTENDEKFLLSHLVPYTSPDNNAVTDGDGSGSMQGKDKIVRYVFDIVRPKVYENLKMRLDELKGVSEVVIAIEIKKDGNLKRAVFVKGSGQDEKDEVCLDSIRKAAPFPSLEGIIDMESVVVNCRFKIF